MTGLSIRRAKAGDEDLILTLLYELAEYEKLTHAFKLTKAVIARDFFAATPLAYCDLAYCEGEPVGLATWYWTYASFAAARGIYLEDLYVRAAMRGRGFGKALLALLAKEARDAGAVRVEWSVLNWNKPSIDFYEGIGAKPNTEWTIYRLDGNALAALAKS
jgi:GNAT superfamily N-acetyltransferase